MHDDFLAELEKRGASPDQVVDLAQGVTPNTLAFVDLARVPVPGTRAPVVYQPQGRPCAYLFDGRETADSQLLRGWIRRVAFRGDAEWVGVLRPGRLDVYPATLDGSAPHPSPDVDDGPLALPSLLHLQPEKPTAIRTRLLGLMRASVRDARDLGLSNPDALSLVGRALFWRFLVDRGLLDGLPVPSVSPRAQTWAECLDDRTRAVDTFTWLDDTFNGGLLPFSSDPRQFPTEVYRRVVGNIAHDADEDGQLSLRLPRRWAEVDFAHVPVGLLSEVYEAYAHDAHAEKAKKESIHYTPRQIAEFVVDEAMAALGEVDAPRVLDPAAGAGVFLVAAFRALVARTWQGTGRRPSRQVVRKILNSQLTGFDINDDALRLAELALYLTAIELDPEERPRPLKLLRFDPLRDRVLVLRDGGAEVGSLAAVEEPHLGAYDLVVGNPPWTASAGREARRRWRADTLDLVRTRLGDARARDFDFADKNPDLPFVYRAMDWARSGGSIALVTHARWLFSQTGPGTRTRRDLLESLHVTGILNGAALRLTAVWPKIQHPFCLVFAVNEVPSPDAAFLFVSPDLDEVPDPLQRRLRIDWQDARPMEVREVVEVPWAMKVRFRGSAFDASVVRSLNGSGIPLGIYLEGIGAPLWNGYQSVGEKKHYPSAEHLHDLRDLRGTQPGLFLDADRLPPFQRKTALFPRPREIYNGPLLLVHESVRTDPLAVRAVYSEKDVAFDERFDGASFARVPNGKDIARYLQLYMQSSIFLHALLMLDAQLGVEREVVHLRTVESIPVVPWEDLPMARRREAAAMSQRLLEAASFDGSTLRRIDHFFADVFGLSSVQTQAIADTLATAMPTSRSKAEALRRTDPLDRKRFREVLAASLDDVLTCGNVSCTVRPVEGLPRRWQAFTVASSDDRSTASHTSPDLQALIELGTQSAASMVKVHLGDGRLLVAMLDRYRYWTTTRARILAGTLLAEGFGA